MIRERRGNLKLVTGISDGSQPVTITIKLKGVSSIGFDTVMFYLVWIDSCRTKVTACLLVPRLRQGAAKKEKSQPGKMRDTESSSRNK